MALGLWLGAASVNGAAETTDAVMRRVFDWQVANLWSTQQPVEHRWGPRGWVHGAFMTGVMEAYRSTGDAAYLDYAVARSEGNGWELGPRLEHADDYVIGQTYLELHAMGVASAELGPLQARVDELLADEHVGRELWWWCDALYMAPQTLAKLAAETGEGRYLETMDAWYWDTHALLYDEAEGLFFRDKRFLDPEDGKKVFWSRGNGWVIAGLARLLDVLPAEHPTRARYLALYREMAAALVKVQPADGLWRANLLHPEAPHGEASGSAFFCYALAWGINQGVLDAAEYRPAVERTWAALLECVTPEGKLGWVQPIGFAPDEYDGTTWQEYGAGAFLAAGSQVRLLE
ncbi:glycoside hydrolase family 88/105 protein [Actomonas aquatica]|uniref:Glycoside hydrolase family 88 protein n=1 Tax=Actomonas aquatica TaxID=2866162 RepID=A0ABZ1C5J0_9BACT|nr:glycoside hydrolase family 88 protein [Opitutus sp. WL0086]WRQ86996.1 glycoside hydrolase family 88 protein [Opitutus sp. WL0086]